MAAGLVYAGLAAYQIYSGFQQAETIRANAELSKELNDFNADLALIDAYEAEKQGDSQSARYQSVIDQTIGSQRVSFAAQGVDVNSGTAKAIQEETKLRGFLNQMDIKNQAHNRALGYQGEARQQRLQGYFAQLQGNVAAASTRNAAIIGAAQTGLSGYEKSLGKPGSGKVDAEAYQTPYTGSFENPYRRPSLYQDFNTGDWEVMG